MSTVDPNRVLSSIRNAIALARPKEARVLFATLDQHLSNGGNLPDAWGRRRDCRYWQKHGYSTRELARNGAEAIRIGVEEMGGTYSTLYPYPCPDGDHWHLSHYQQGRKTCPSCGQSAPAWNGGKVWVIGAHLTDGAPCTGEGKNR